MKSIKDVAQLAGVSITTVSHVLNGTRKVSDVARRRVQLAIDQSGYVPSGVARSLRMSATQTIGVLVPDISSPFSAELAQGMAEVARERGYALMLGNFANQPEDQMRALQDLLTRRVDGLLLAAGVYNHQVLVDTLSRSGRRLPVLLIDHEPDGLHVDSLSSSQSAYGHLAVNRLLQLGHERIACINGPEHLFITPLRMQAWREALQVAGITPESDWSVFGEFTPESGYELGKAMLVSKRFSAIIAGADVIALGLMRAASELGVRVPEDVSVVCYDMHRMGNYVYPPLDSVGSDVKEKGRRAMALLIDRVGQTDAPIRRESFPTTAVWRASSAAPSLAFSRVTS